MSERLDATTTVGAVTATTTTTTKIAAISTTATTAAKTASASTAAASKTTLPTVVDANHPLIASSIYANQGLLSLEDFIS